MTRRERLEQKLERRREWAEGRRGKAESIYKYTDRYHGDVAFHTQPGHIPERARVIRMTDKAHEHVEMAKHHEEKAAGLADQLDRTVFSDDNNAIEALEARIAEREVEAERYAAINKAWRKSKGDVAALVASGLVGEKLAETITKTMSLCPWLKVPLDTTSLRAAIRRDRERIEDVKARTARTAGAEAAGGVMIEDLRDGWVRVTFAEKPDRPILNALKAAGFHWGSGYWAGKKDNLPKDLTP